VPLLPSERKNADRSAARVGDETLRAALATARRRTCRTGPRWYPTSCGISTSQLYLGGMDLLAIQAALGHAWVATTMN
jgi:hypothetical protein